MRYAAIFCLALAACGPFPSFDVDGASDGLTPPELVPLDALLAAAPAAGATAPTGDLNARLAALKSRAARLRGPVIPASVRARMARGVAIPGPIR